MINKIKPSQSDEHSPNPQFSILNPFQDLKEIEPLFTHLSQHRTTQTILPLGFREAKTFSNFYVGRNDAALSILQKTAVGRGEYFIYLWGKEKAGLTHLLHACCQIAQNKGLTTFYLSLKDYQKLQPSVFDNLETVHLVCIDDFEKIAGDSVWEEAFFDFFNRMQEAKKRLIVAAKKPPEKLGLKLNDVRSRLKSGIVFYIQELTDEEKVQALIARAHNRGMHLPMDVALFIFHRSPRDLGTLFQILDHLDHASLEHQRKLTIPFVKQVMVEMGAT